MDLYLAVCDETNTAKVFTDYEDFREFAVKERYAYSYFKLGNVDEIPDVELFYYD
ncbi:hypothetical protein M3649_03765 [Ureibacillus chungkukjangi]|uniref:hypothetical protein n=1 Tax=Ureibacillus chungkukjangi TaxID=1202712 RepID=UPI00203DDE90|nr:hypothetical protein [Ureibacillus chungkukjangi]MCM3387248.1 hypothetical protein [Ureibacillus chungkukjangi]